MRVKAPAETGGKRNTMMTPGRMMMKTRVPLSASKVPRMTHGSSHMSDTTILNFSECPDFLKAASQSGLVGGGKHHVGAPQTPGRSHSTVAHGRTPGKPLTMKQCIEKTEKENMSVGNSATITPKKPLAKICPTFAASVPKSLDPASETATTVSSVSNHKELVKLKASVEIQPPAMEMALVVQHAPINRAIQASTPSIFSSSDEIKPLLPASKALTASGKLVITKVQPTLDPSSLPFPPTPQSHLPASKLTKPIEEPIAHDDKSMTAAPLGNAISSASTPATAPLSLSSTPSLLQATQDSIVINANSTKPVPEKTVALESKTESGASSSEFGNRLRSIALERQALLKMLQRLQEEENKLIADYFMRTGSN